MGILKQARQYFGQMLITCDNGDVYTMKGERGNAIFIDFLHHLVHSERVFTVSHTFLNVAADGKVRIHLKTDGNAVHFEINWNSDLKTRLKTYESPTITANGTLHAPFNRVVGSTKTPTSLWYLNSTFTGGIMRGNDFIGSNTGSPGSGTRAGGSTSGRFESVLIPSQDYIIEFENVGGAIEDVGVVVNFYESPWTGVDFEG
jgi:hypothetical protein